MSKSCPYCNKNFEVHSLYANHVRWCKLNPKYENINKNKNISKGMTLGYNKRLGEFKEFEVRCFICNTTFKVVEREKIFPKKKKYFCNRSCANSQRVIKNKESHRTNTSLAIKEMWKNPIYIENVMRKKCAYNSKGELAIRNYFKWNYPKDRWTFGGSLKYNGIPLIRDLYSNKLKVCIEYDGIWHFEDIIGQLKDKQIKDNSLEEWCLKNNYRLIRIKEDVFLKDEEFWIKQIENEVYKGVGRIVKFY